MTSLVVILTLSNENLIENPTPLELGIYQLTGKKETPIPRSSDKILETWIEKQISNRRILYMRTFENKSSYDQLCKDIREKHKGINGTHIEGIGSTCFLMPHLEEEIITYFNTI